MTRRNSPASTLRLFLDQIASLQGPEHDHARCHRQGEHEQNDAQPGAPIWFVASPHDTHCSRGQDERQDERQSSARRGEVIEHQSRFPLRAQAGLHCKRRRITMFPEADGLSERRQ